MACCVVGVTPGCFYFIFFNIIFDIHRTVSTLTLRDRTTELWACSWGSLPVASASIGQTSLALFTKTTLKRGRRVRMFSVLL